MELRRTGVRLVLGVALFAGPVLGFSWPGPAMAQGKHNIEGTPLDTLMNTHLTPDVPEAKDFVKETRPDPKSLTYAPLTAPEQARPKPLSPKGVAALQAELDAAAAKNNQKAKGLIKPAPKVKPKPNG